MLRSEPFTLAELNQTFNFDPLFNAANVWELKYKAQALAKRGFIYYKEQHDDVRALQEYTTAMVLNPNNAFAKVRSKVIHERLGDHATALADDQAL